MKAQLTYWKYRAEVTPTVSFSEEFHYFLRSEVCKGTIHIHYNKDNITVITLCFVPPKEEMTYVKFCERYAMYKRFVSHQVFLKSVPPHDVYDLSMLEWTFDQPKEEDTDDFFNALVAEAWGFSEKFLETIKTLFHTRPIEYLL